MSLVGLYKYEIDEENCCRYFLFATADQMNLTMRFLSFVSFDGTYKTNNEDSYLYQVVALDMNLVVIPVCTAFIGHETSALLTRLQSFFRRSINNRKLVGNVTDESSVMAATITQVYPNSPHFLSCTPQS
ncbi:unnamed protein product [Schistosoma margrebowiei]|uniref:Uncharacterized protein n=1 Tax=Schistosoma margrebowiei TaxID=48269 RepID=A0A183N8E8_9TREM|nr:unnamed protein product [Schistosoma margrebowiei]